MKPENRQPETNRFKLVTTRPNTYRRLKMFCARTGSTIIDVTTKALDEYLSRVQEQPNA